MRLSRVPSDDNNPTMYWNIFSLNVLSFYSLNPKNMLKFSTGQLEWQKDVWILTSPNRSRTLRVRGSVTEQDWKTNRASTGKSTALQLLYGGEVACGPI